jgi:transcription antitermination factor NusG
VNGLCIVALARANPEEPGRRQSGRLGGSGTSRPPRTARIPNFEAALLSRSVRAESWCCADLSRAVVSVLSITTEGGEALPNTDDIVVRASGRADTTVTAADGSWYAIWTHSHCEHLVRQQLVAKGFHPFLPEVQTWSKRLGLMRLIRTPMFPGYLFVRDAMDRKRYLALLQVRGLVRILENGWDKLTPIPDDEIDAIQRIVRADVPVLPCVHLRQGDRVRVREGALMGLEGIFLQDKLNKGRLVVSVTMLGRSVAVEVECTSIEACAPQAVGLR